MVSRDKSSAKDEVRFNVRVPPDLHQRIVAQAATVGKSMNSFLIDILMEALDDPEGKWQQAASAELMRLSEEEAVYEDRLLSLRERRLKIMRAWAEREGDGDTLRDIDQDLAEITRLVEKGLKDG